MTREKSQTKGPSVLPASNPVPGDRFSVQIRGSVLLAVEQCELSIARESYLDFVILMHKLEGKPFVVGRHTRKIAERIDEALTDLFTYQRSTYLTISVPFRHGKSLLASRYLPAYIIGKFCTRPYKNKFNPHNILAEEILASYASELSKLLSREARQIVASAAYRKIFGNVELSREASSVMDWQTVDAHPDSQQAISYKVQAVGLLGSVTGRGGVFLVVDDPIKNREEAESQTVRDKTWDSFTNDFMSRLAPVHVVLLIGTRWHTDDVIGRVKERNDPKNEKYDPKFPHFEAIDFKAMEEDGKYLFPERFGPEWYQSQFATLGPYSAAALLQGEPISKGGNLLPTDKVQYWDTVPPSLSLSAKLSCRAWDLASSGKEQVKDDPDWTAGPKGFIHFDETIRPSMTEDQLRARCLFIVSDCRMIRAIAGPRDALIIETAREDGALVWQGIEGQGGYKDAATTLQTVLLGTSVVHKITVHRDKYSRIAELHPLIDAGHLVLVRGPWNQLMSKQLSEFPSGKHDDLPDALATLWKMAFARAVKALRSGFYQAAGQAAGRGWMDIDKKEETQDE